MTHTCEAQNGYGLARRARRRTPRGRRAFTLMEVLLALFILLVGVVGVMAALPTGINHAKWVIFQDAAVSLAHSKFAEFRRDRMDPSQSEWNGYLDNMGPTVDGELFRTFVPRDADLQEPPSSDRAKYLAYWYFDDIKQYLWKVDYRRVGRGANNDPSYDGASLECYRVAVTIRMTGVKRSFRFVQLMTPYR